MSPHSLTSDDREAAWSLLLAAYETAAALSDAGFALCRARYLAGDRDAGLITVLGRALVARRDYDEFTRDVLEQIAERDSEEGRTARRVVVRCDANLAAFRPERVDWYEEALTGGSLTAGFVLARGALAGQLDDRPELAAEGLARCLDEATPRQWEQAALDRKKAVRQLADHHLARPPSEAGIRAVEAGYQAARGKLSYLRWLVEAYRPSLSARAVECYLALCEKDPDDQANTRFLAEAVIDRRLRIDDACPVLERYLAVTDDPAAARRALAHEAVRLRRDDADAMAWIRAAMAEGDSSRELYGWLAVCEVRHGEIDEVAGARLRAVALDGDMPRPWRREVGLALAERVHQSGARDAELYWAVWRGGEPDTAPRWLAGALAALLIDADRTDADTAPIYRAAYQAEPSDALAWRLARAYLHDRDTPVREKIEHWRACLARGETDGEILVALAQALATEGAATEAALAVVDEMPAAQQPRMLEELFRHRFGQGEFAAAETIASRLRRLLPDDPAVQYRLAVCRIRRLLGSGGDLREVDLAGDHPRLEVLRALVAAAAGDEPDDSMTADAIEASGAHSPALGVAVAALRGHDVRVPPVETGIPRNTWLLAAVEQMQGQTARARRRLQATEDPDLRLWERYLAARQALDEGRGAAACELLLPVLHRSGPPWEGPREMLAALAPRYASAELLDRLAPLLTPAEQQAARLRVLVQRALAGDEEAAAAASGGDDALGRALPLALLAEQAAAAYVAGDLEGFATLVERLREAGDEPDRVAWFSALLHRERGEDRAAFDAAFQLSEPARATPAVAAQVASWYLRDGALSRAEAVLSHALRFHRNNVDLLSAVATINAQLGRTEKFLALVPVILHHLPPNDPRGGTLGLLRDVLERPLAELDPAALTTSLDSLDDEAAELRLLLLFGHAADRIERGGGALVCSTLKQRLDELKRVDCAPALVAELRNALGYGHYLAGEWDAADGALAQVAATGAAVPHNRAVTAEAAAEAGDAVAERLDAAVRWRQEAAELWARAPFDDVAPGYRDAVLFALHQHTAGLCRRLERWPDELRHLEACIAIRPYDVVIQRASLQPLLAMGEGERALHKSQWLLGEQPDDLEVQLDHATVLASTRGAGEALAWLEQVGERNPDAVEAVRQRREELREKLLETSQRRAESGDYVGMFAAARDVEQIAETPQQRARALLQQAYALSQMADDENATAVLEQALAKCREALEAAGPGRTRQRAEQVAEQVRGRLAPLWARQAEELFLHRRKEYFTLAEQLNAPPPEGVDTARGLALAFERVADLYRQAVDCGDTALNRQVQPRIDEALRLAREARQLEAQMAGPR